MKDLEELLAAVVKEWGFTLPEEAIEKFRTYLQELRQWNEKINLTAVVEPREVYLKHFLDSLSILAHYNPQESARAIDIGSGAGFPGLPLKIVRPDIYITLLESVSKKVFFLEHLVRLLGLKGVEVVKGRAEELAHQTRFRESYDFAVARAVASLPVVLEYALPFLKCGAVFVAYKGPGVETELNISKRALDLLGGKIKGVKRLVLPNINHERFLVLVEKVGATPLKYPRRPGVPIRRPL